MTVQPRDALGQFASKECAGTYRLLVSQATEPVPWQPNYTAVEAPRCSHGSFLRYAVRNCCKPMRGKR